MNCKISKFFYTFFIFISLFCLPTVIYAYVYNEDNGVTFDKGSSKIEIQNVEYDVYPNFEVTTERVQDVFDFIKDEKNIGVFGKRIVKVSDTRPEHTIAFMVPQGETAGGILYDSIIFQCKFDSLLCEPFVKTIYKVEAIDSFNGYYRVNVTSMSSWLTAMKILEENKDVKRISPMYDNGVGVSIKHPR